jgi:hypothetical protein
MKLIADLLGTNDGKYIVLPFQKKKKKKNEINVTTSYVLSFFFSNKNKGSSSHFHQLESSYSKIHKNVKG